MIGQVNDTEVAVPTPARPASKWRDRDGGFLAFLLLAIFIVKFAVLAFDHQPRFLMGDSGSYLHTALTGWIPEDRSFTYGYLIRPLTVLPHSLIPLLVFQTFLGALTSWIVGYCLRRYLKAPRWLAALCALLCAIEPLQLFAERFVLTETTSLFFFALVVWLSLEYLESGQLVALAGIQILSVALISIRLSYLPLVVTNSFLLPLLGPAAVSMFRAMRARKHAKENRSTAHVFATTRLMAAHVAVAVLLCQAALYGYRKWNGHLSHRAAAYTYTDGLFLASFWAPVIEARDFPIAELREPIFGHLKFELKDPRRRNNQCFSPGGLDQNIVKETTAKFGGDGLTYPNKLAKKAALRAAKRNPLALLHLFSVTAEEYFDQRYLRSAIQLEEGFLQVAGADFDALLQKNFHQDYEPLERSLVQKWHLLAEPWYQFLLLVPLVFTIVAIVSGRRYARQKIFFAVAVFGLTLGAIALTQEPTVRYMVPDAWLTPLIFGATLAAVLSGRPAASGAVESQREA